MGEQETMELIKPPDSGEICGLQNAAAAIGKSARLLQLRVRQGCFSADTQPYIDEETRQMVFDIEDLRDVARARNWGELRPVPASCIRPYPEDDEHDQGGDQGGDQGDDQGDDKAPPSLGDIPPGDSPPAKPVEAKLDEMIDATPPAPTPGADVASASYGLINLVTPLGVQFCQMAPRATIDDALEQYGPGKYVIILCDRTGKRVGQRYRQVLPGPPTVAAGGPALQQPPAGPLLPQVGDRADPYQQLLNQLQLLSTMMASLRPQTSQNETLQLAKLLLEMHERGFNQAAQFAGGAAPAGGDEEYGPGGGGRGASNIYDVLVKMVDNLPGALVALQQMKAGGDGHQPAAAATGSGAGPALQG